MTESSPPAIPSVQELYDMAQREGSFPGVGREYFDKLPRMLLFAAVDPAGYSILTHAILDSVNVPQHCHRFDHAFVVKMVREMMGPPQPDSSDESS